MKGVTLQVLALSVAALGHYFIFIIFTSSEGHGAATLGFECCGIASPDHFLIVLNVAMLLTKATVLRITSKFFNFCNFVQDLNEIQAS